MIKRYCDVCEEFLGENDFGVVEFKTALGGGLTITVEFRFSTQTPAAARPHVADICRKCWLTFMEMETANLRKELEDLESVQSVQEVFN